MKTKLSLLLTLACGAALLAACGQKETPPPAAPAAAPAATTTAAAPAATTTAAAAPAAAPAGDNAAAGKKVFGTVCAVCHAAGVAGAPKPGDKADWGPRIAQGNDLLYTHAIKGFTGAKGMMPARGGSSSLSDDDVKAAVDYMVAQSR